MIESLNRLNISSDAELYLSEASHFSSDGTVILLDKNLTDNLHWQRWSRNTSFTFTDIFKCKTLNTVAEGLLQLLIHYTRVTCYANIIRQISTREAPLNAAQFEK
jgi:hypothetical protein